MLDNLKIIVSQVNFVIKTCNINFTLNTSDCDVMGQKGFRYWTQPGERILIMAIIYR